MKTFRFFPVKLIFFIFILLLAVLSFFLFKRIDNLSRAADNVNSSSAVHLNLEETISWLREAESSQRGFLLTNDSLYLQARSVAYRKMEGALNKVHEGLVNDTLHQRQADTLKLLIEQRVQLLDKVMWLHKQSHHQEDGIKTDILHGSIAMNAVLAYAEKMMISQDKMHESRLHNYKNYTFIAPLHALLLILFVLCFFIVAYLSQVRQLRISRQLAFKTETANQQLKKANTIFEMAEEAGGVGSWILNLETRKTEWSKNLCQLYGFDASNYDPTLDKHMEVVHPLDREKLQLARENAYQHSQPIILEFRIIRADGETRQVRSFSKLTINEKGERELMGTTQDVTGFTHITQRLKETNALYENAESIASIGSWQLDLQTSDFTCSKNLFHIYGSEPQDRKISLEVFLLYVHPKDRDEVIRQINSIAHTGSLEKVSYRIIRKDGVLRNMQSTGKLVESNEGKMILGTTQDVTEITEAVESLKVSEAFNRNISELAPNAIYVYELATGKMVYTNENIKTLHGYTQEELAGLWPDLISVIHPDDKQGLMNARQRYLTMKDEDVVEMQFRVMHKNGSWQNIYGHSRVFKRNAQGEVTQVIGVATNITEVKRSAENLAKTNASFENAEIAAGIGSWSWNLETGEFTASNNMFRVYGFEPFEFQPASIQSFFGHVYPDDRKIVTLQFSDDDFSQNRVQTLNYRIVDKQGKLIHVQGKRSFFRNEKGERVVLGTVQNISVLVRVIRRLSRAITQLKKSEAFNRSITELAPNAIYIYDLPSNTSAFVNKNLLEIHGYTEQDIARMGSDWLQKMVHPDDLPGVLHNLQSFAEVDETGVHKQEYRLLNKKGEWRYHFAREVVFKRNEEGGAEQIIGVATDITDLKEAAEKLDRLNRSLTEKNSDLQQANEELASFNYVASHDLQEPLRKIQTFINFLVEREDLSEAGNAYLKRMQQAASRMRNLIRDLLSYSRTTMVDNVVMPVDLNDVLVGTKSALKTLIDEKSAVIQSGPLPTVPGVDFQMQQLFDNLVGNAIKYCSPELRPVVMVTAERVRSARNTQSEQEIQWYHKISFADNGIGFEQEYAGKIFELFQRLHSKTEYEGTGIGLAICKKIVLRHGGFIEASGIPGGGATFMVYLPANEQ